MKQNYQDETQKSANQQPRRLSIRRPSYKREVLDNERFTDILLKPVLKEKVEPLTAEKETGQLTKVKNEQKWFHCKRKTYQIIFCVTNIDFEAMRLKKKYKAYN